MMSPAGSLIDAHAQQQDLLPPDMIPPADPVGADRRQPEFTAASFFKNRPEEYKLAVALLFADGLHIAQIARMLGVSRNTISAVYEREADSQNVEQLRRKALAGWRSVGRLARERLTDILLHIPDARDLTTEQRATLAHKLGVVAGIAQDKESELSGLTIPRVVVHIDATDAYQDMLERAREHAGKMGLGDGARAEKRALGAVPGAGDDGRELTARPSGIVLDAEAREEVGQDAVSNVLGGIAESFRPCDVTQDVKAGGPEAGDGGPGGGLVG